MTNPFAAIVLKRKKCPMCDAPDAEAGIFERIDCGCVFEFVVGRYATAAAARLVAARHASLKGTRHGGRNTGDWSVESDDGIIEAGKISPKSAPVA